MKQRHALEFSEWEKEVLKDPALKAEYDRLQPEFAVIEAVLKARMESGMTQTSLARRMGTKQSVISRVEKGRTNPTLRFLQKMAGALNTHLEVRFVAE